MATCEEMRATLSDLLVAVTGRLEGFERCTKDMWQDLSADRFRKLERRQIVFMSLYILKFAIL